MWWGLKSRRFDAVIGLPAANTRLPRGLHPLPGRCRCCGDLLFVGCFRGE